jgi:putative DNA primase/helicase
MSASYAPAVEAELARLAGLSWDAFRDEVEDAAERLEFSLGALHAAVAERRAAAEAAAEKSEPDGRAKAATKAEKKVREKGAKQEREPIKPAPNIGRDGRKVIPSVAGDLDRMASAAEVAIIQAGVPFFQRAHELVRPVPREVPASHGRTTLAAGLAALASPAIRDVLCGVAEFCRYDKRSDEWRVIDPPGDVAAILLAREGRWRLPVIAGVTTTPTLRPDGSLLIEPGYDPATRLYHAGDPALRLTPAALNAKPSRSDAEAALELLKDLLAEFPFVRGGGEGEPKADTSVAVALSGCITPVVRGAMSMAPMHAFRASTAGTGKSYMVDVASAIATGRLCPVTSVAPEEAETEKRLTGLLLSGFPVVSLDNVNGELGGDLLAQATERTMLRLCPLGTSRIVEIENRAVIFATGNNLRVRGDMVRRVMLCDLDAGVERPELREFKADPVATVLSVRGAYVSAALVIVRAYLAAGTPGLLPPVQSYADWSRLVRSALVWLGCTDPVGSMDAARADDPELDQLSELLRLWKAAFGNEALTVKDAALAAASKEESVMGEPPELRHAELNDAFLRIAGDRGVVSTLRLGNFLRDRQGRIINKLRFVRKGGAGGGVVRWTVEAR